jgi:hypothetical protein
MLRNPDERLQDFSLNLAEALELPPGAPSNYRLTSPWAEDSAKPAILARADPPLPLLSPTLRRADPPGRPERLNPVAKCPCLGGAPKGRSPAPSPCLIRIARYGHSESVRKSWESTAECMSPMQRPGSMGFERRSDPGQRLNPPDFPEM